MSMTFGTWFTSATNQLVQATIETARLDVLVLMEDALGKDRAQLLAHPEYELSSSQQNVLDAQVARRVQHEPLAYIRGKVEFYGREFVVSPAVLVPRPESETMIELLITTLHTRHQGGPWRIADIGTGSGSLGITAYLELSKAHIDLVDIDVSALETAKLNVIKFTSGLKTIQSDLLGSTTASYDILLCNLPYVPDGYAINRAAKTEPKLALFGGPDGLDLYRKLFDQIRKLPSKPLLILTESLPVQHSALLRLATAHGYNQTKEEDFIQLFELNN